MEQESYISIRHLAEQLGMDRSHARRYVLKLGFKPQKRRTADSGSQLSLTVTTEEADAILRHRSDQGFTAEGKAVESVAGVFYLIQLVPELDPKRIKLGFAIDITDRLAQHRTAAPTAIILKSWPCKRSWEATVMDCLSSVACRHILNEVFECDSLEDMIGKGDELFHILPEPKRRAELSEHSPHRR
jgi:biotin operon repressor